MTQDADSWVRVASFSTGLEADIACATLEAAGIPVRVRSDRSGVFGATFQGAIPGGLILSVPQPEAERARELLDWDDPEEERPSAPPA